jgi:hypothetical protein
MQALATSHVAGIRTLLSCSVAQTHLGDHHMAVKCPSATGSLRPFDMGSDFRHDGCTECDVGNEVAIHLLSPRNFDVSKLFVLPT